MVSPLIFYHCHLVLKGLRDFQDMGLEENWVKSPKLPTYEWNDRGWDKNEHSKYWLITTSSQGKRNMSNRLDSNLDKALMSEFPVESSAGNVKKE